MGMRWTANPREDSPEAWFVNADDRSIEGLVHAKKPCIAVQFHPEASPGPYDTSSSSTGSHRLKETAEDGR